MYRPDTLVVSSGAEKGMAEIGALEEPYRQGLLSQVKTYVGCSVGAIIVYLLAIGLAPNEIMVLGLGIKLFGGGLDLRRLGESYGVCDHSTVMDTLTQVSLFRLRKLPTFLELFQERGLTLVIPAVDIYAETPVAFYFDHRTSPDLQVLEAIRRSISIQPLFPPVVDGDRCWVDGGIVDPFPIAIVDDGQHEILGVHTQVSGSSPRNFLEHMMLLTSLLVDEVKRLKLTHCSHRVNILTVPLTDRAPSDDPMARLELYYQGYYAGTKFVDALLPPVAAPTIAVAAPAPTVEPRLTRVPARKKMD